MDIPVLDAYNVDPGQTPHSVASDLDLHFLLITLLGVSQLKWVHSSFLFAKIKIPN